MADAAGTSAPPPGGAALPPSPFAAAQPQVGKPEASTVKPALKQLSSLPGAAFGVANGQPPPGRAVSWMDAGHGQQLTHVREFEPSEFDSSEQSYDERGWCCCLQ